MAESKGTIIGIRVSSEEKELLTEEATALGLSLSQYMRYKVLEEDSKTINQQKSAHEFLDKHMAKMARMIIDGWVHTKAMMENNLSDEQKRSAADASAKEIARMGIKKYEEKYGQKTPKDSKN